MMDTGTIAEIIATYKKHGWVLRRVLLSAAASAALDGKVVEGVSVMHSDVDAAWFSRPPAEGGVAWEIRYLGPTPFALVENIDENEPDFEERLRSVEARLAAAVASKKSA